GLSLFVTKLALPALLFSGMASLDFSKVNWSFLLAVTIGKTAVFFLALGITMLLDIGKPQVVGTGAVNGIFVSQSNDFALGLPIFQQPIFGALHPEYIGYLYLVAPISLIFLNPLGFLLMESDRKGGPDGEEGEEEEDEDGEERVGGRGVRDGREGEGDPWECCDLVPEGEEAALMALEEEKQRDGEPGGERGGKGAVREKGKEEGRQRRGKEAVGEKGEDDGGGESVETSSLSHPPTTTVSLAPSPSTSLAPVHASLAPSPLSRVLPSPLGPPSPVAAATGPGMSDGAGATAGGAGVSGGGDGGGGGAVDLPQGWTRRAYTGKLAAGGGGGKLVGARSGKRKGRGGARSHMRMWKVLYGVFASPVVFMVPLGLAANYLFSHDIPPLLSGPFESFGAAFSPLSLFILGMSMADETEKASDEQTRLGPLLLSLALVAGKCLVLPLLILLLLASFQADDTSLSLAGLIYGSLPVMPATFFFACEYGLCQSYIGMATVLGTFLFGPLVYVLTQLAFLVMNHYEQLLEQVESSSRSMALVGGICALWTLLALLRLLLSCRPAPPAFPRATTTTAAQAAAESGVPAGAGTAIEGSGTEGTGAAAAAAGAAEGGRGGSKQDPYELHRVTSASVASLLCRTPLPPLPSLLRYVFHTTGHLASAVFTALLALSELLCSALGPSLVHRLRFYLVFSGWVLAALPVVLPLVLSPGWPDIPALCPTDL
ncbi:unnamed protein product, partial [Closterium sp. Naga37s-1]